jgi:ABC-type branched-subunit amino acid transport system substrate-binding protein
VSFEPLERPPGHAFISYVREDTERVARLTQLLTDAGIRVWRDTENLWPGQDWKIQIREAITSGTLAFVACFSDSSEGRETTYQNEEIILAVEQMRLRPRGRSWLIPVRFSECTIPEYDLGAGRNLHSLQRVDLFDGGWEPQSTRLVAAIATILSSDSGAPTAHTALSSDSGAPTAHTALSSDSGAPTAHTEPDHRAGRNIWVVGIVLILAVALVYGIFRPTNKPPMSIVPTNAPIPCSPKPRSLDGVLTFGTLLPQSGSFIYAGPAREAAVRLAINDIKKVGGIPNITITPDPYNLNEGSPSSDDIVSQSTDELLSRVSVIIGPATSQAALKVRDKVVCAGAIMFSPSVTSSFFTTNFSSSHGLFFRAAPSSNLEGRALGGLVANDGNSTAVVISRNDEYGNSLRSDTVQEIRGFGLSVPDSFSYDPNVLNYSQDIQRIKKINPDAIVVIGFNDCAKVLAEMINQGLGPASKRVYVSGSGLTNDLAIRTSPQKPGVLAGVKGTPLAKNEILDDRLKKDSPDLNELSYAAQAYDAVVVTALAAAVAGTGVISDIAKEVNNVTKVGEQTCGSFADCMKLINDHKKFSYVGPAGPLDFTNSGEPRSGTYAISQITSDGKLVFSRNITVGR